MTGTGQPVGGESGSTRILDRLLSALSRLSPAPVDEDAGSDELAQSLRFLSVKATPKQVVAAGYGAGILVTVVGGLAVGLAPAGWRLPLLPLVLAIALGMIHGVHRLPVFVAAIRRTMALGRAPALIGRAVLRMHVDPSEEAAVQFAVDSGDDPLTASLERHVRAAADEPRTGLDEFARTWESWFPALPRSVTVLSSAANAPPQRRDRTLDRALAAVLDGTRDRMAAFVTEIRGPATALYAFGVLLPLALVAVLPAARAAGAPITPAVVVLLYNVLLPAVLIGACGWLLVRRPVAFPPPDVAGGHPDIPSRRWPRILGGVLVGAVAAVLVGILYPWARPLVAIGIGLGSILLLLARPYVTVREQARAVEEGLVDALYLVGRHVDEGRSVEGAVAVAGEQLGGETGAVFDRAGTVCDRLGLGIHRSFFGEYGALATVPSPRAHDAAALLSIAAREGKPAGTAIVSMASHLEELQSVEREARHELAQVTDTLGSTGSIFGPLVAGATVALADGMATFAGDGAELTPIPAETLGLAIGCYVLLLAVLLTGLSVALARGLDGPLLAYRIGGALCSATVIFCVAVYGAGLVM